MKIRYLTITFTILIAIFIGIIILQIRYEGNQTDEITTLNAENKQIMEGLKQGEARDSLEKVFGCQIILKSDADYASRLNEAVKDHKTLMDYEAEEQLIGKIIFDGQMDVINALWSSLQNKMIIASIGILFIGYFILGLFYYFYVRPFHKLQQFAVNVAKGNLDAPIFMQKGNYFGAFTESFDLMREELKRARENEYKANISKKELVAELSHDMKTPIATIKATCEVLKMKTQRNGNTADSKDLLDKIGIIEQRSDMIDQLIGNMFHATLEELENLKVEAVEEASTGILSMFEDLQYYENLQIKNTIPEYLVYLDKLRLKQVIDNIVHNSFKYAGTVIEVSFEDVPAGIKIEIRDYGNGVAEEELPLITEKYYRGANGKGKNGAGLGLFLANYFMNHMKGSLECYNDHGFVVNLFISKV